jgi:hypothetical protein
MLLEQMKNPIRFLKFSNLRIDWWSQINVVLLQSCKNTPVNVKYTLKYLRLISQGQAWWCTAVISTTRIGRRIEVRGQPQQKCKTLSEK